MLVAFRNFKQKPAYSLINIFGLATGVACSFLIFLFVWNEISYDKYHDDADRIYRITQTFIMETSENLEAGTPFPMAEAILAEYPDMIEAAVRFNNLQTETSSMANRETKEYIREENFFFVDGSVFNVFDIEFLRGNPETALQEPNTVVLSETAAKKYFKDEDPMGKSIMFEGRFAITVTGIMKDWPKNSHFRADVLASFESLASLWQNYDEITSRWRWNPNWTYIKLAPGADPAQLEALFPGFTEKYYTTDAIGENESVYMHLQPLEDIWLFSEANGEIEATGNFGYVVLFSVISILIIIIAAINFTNLSTAKAIQRAREVGLRKTLGADKSTLRFQFMAESFLYTLLSVFIGILIAYMILPVFNHLLDKSIQVQDFNLFVILSGILLIIVIVGFLSGLYPAFILSSFNPVESLRAAMPNPGGTGLFRKILVTFQFSVSALLLISTALIYLQYNHIKYKDPGYNTEQTVILPTNNTWVLYDLDIYLDRLREHPDIISASGSRAIMGSERYSQYLVSPEGFDDRELSISKIIVTHDFIETLGINLIAGRNFSEEFKTDKDEAILVNESTIDFLGWGSPEETLGKYMDYLGFRKRVIGVTEDFHYTHLKREIDPLIMELPPSLNSTLVNINFIKVKLRPGSPEPALAHMKEHWDKLDSAHPFEYFFYDDYIDTVYRAEQKMSEVVSILSALAIVVACMGLFGLASYSVHKRQREIGIRKAMGASAPSVFFLLSKDFLKLILMAAFIAFPVSVYLANQWLQNFPYKIELLSVLMWVFPAVLLLLTLISLMSIGAQSVRAALMAPVEVLKR